MRRILALARKDLRAVLRERSIVLALLVQFLVAAFSAFLAFGLVGLFAPESLDAAPPGRIAYVGPGGFDAHLEAAPNLALVRLPSDDALAAFRAGTVDAVAHESQDGPDGVRTVTLLLPDGEFRTTLLVTQLKNLLRDYEREQRVERDDRIHQPLVFVDTPAPPTPFFGFAHAVLLPLLVLTPAFLAGAITADAITVEANTRTLEILRSTPLRLGELLAGKLLTPVLLAPAQVILWVGLLRLNGMVVHHPVALGVFAVSLALLLSLTGAVLALLVRREGHVQAAFALVVVALLAGGLLLPQGPFNLIARLAAGSTDGTTWGTLVLVAAASVALVPLAAWVARGHVARSN